MALKTFFVAIPDNKNQEAKVHLSFDKLWSESVPGLGATIRIYTLKANDADEAREYVGKFFSGEILYVLINVAPPQH